MWVVKAISDRESAQEETEAIDRSIKLLERKLREVKVQEAQTRLKDIEKSMPEVQERQQKAREEAANSLPKLVMLFRRLTAVRSRRT